MRIPEQNVPVPRQLLGLLGGDASGSELVERHVGRQQLVNDLARHADGLRPVPDAARPHAMRRRRPGAPPPRGARRRPRAPGQGRQASRGRHGPLGLTATRALARAPHRTARRRAALRDRRTDGRPALVTRRGARHAPAARSRGRGPPTLRAPSAAPRPCRGDGARGRPAQRHPTTARPRQPRRHLRLPARHRHQRDHRHGPRATRSDAARQLGTALAVRATREPWRGPGRYSSSPEARSRNPVERLAPVRARGVVERDVVATHCFASLR